MKLDKGLISFFVICLLFALVLVHDHNRAEEAKVRRAQDVSKRREAEARSSQRAADLDKREKDIRASVEKLSTPVKGAGIIDEIKHGPRAFLDDNQKTAQKDTEGVVKKIREPLPTLAEVQADLGPATRNAAETSFVRARVYSLSGGRFAGTETVLMGDQIRRRHHGARIVGKAVSREAAYHPQAVGPLGGSRIGWLGRPLQG